MYTSVVVDGNDGLGKTTLVEGLRELGYLVSDRGPLTYLTVSDSDLEQTRFLFNPNTLYILLDGSVELSTERLQARGADMSDHYHQPDILGYYRQLYLTLANKFKVSVFSAHQTKSKLLKEVTLFLTENNVYVR